MRFELHFKSDGTSQLRLVHLLVRLQIHENTVDPSLFRLLLSSSSIFIGRLMVPNLSSIIITLSIFRLYLSHLSDFVGAVCLVWGPDPLLGDLRFTLIGCIVLGCQAARRNELLRKFAQACQISSLCTFALCSNSYWWMYDLLLSWM